MYLKMTPLSCSSSRTQTCGGFENKKLPPWGFSPNSRVWGAGWGRSGVKQIFMFRTHIWVSHKILSIPGIQTSGKNEILSPSLCLKKKRMALFGTKFAPNALRTSSTSWPLHGKHFGSGLPSKPTPRHRLDAKSPHPLFGGGGGHFLNFMNNGAHCPSQTACCG